MTEQYTHLAKAYDKLMYDVSYEKWAEYIKSIVKDKNIIEYACGTGSLTLLMAQSGYNIIALDISEDMLQAAQEKLYKAGKQAMFVCDDMCSFKLNKKVDSAICCCDGVNYITKENKLEDFFKSVYDNLAKEGIFTFDISSEYKVLEILGNEFFYDDGDTQTLLWQNSLDKNMLTMNITLFSGKNNIYTRYDEKHLFRGWKEEEITQMLEKCGFKEIKVCDFLTFEAPKARSERIQFIAKRQDI